MNSFGEGPVSNEVSAAPSTSPVSAILSSVLLLSPYNPDGGTIVGGNTTNAEVLLRAAAPAGGITVNLSSSNTSLATVPANVTVPAGSQAAFLVITTLGTTSSGPVHVAASYGGVTDNSANLIVSPADIANLWLYSSTVTGTAPTTGEVDLSGAAPPGGVTVSLSSSNTNTATVPSTITIPAGANHGNYASATFTVTTAAVAADTNVTITASYRGKSFTAPLKVQAPPSLQDLIIFGSTPATVAGGNALLAEVVLTNYRRRRQRAFSRGSFDECCASCRKCRKSFQQQPGSCVCSFKYHYRGKHLPRIHYHHSAGYERY